MGFLWEMKGVSRVGREYDHMCSKKNSRSQRRVSVLALAFLLCVFLMSGCGKDGKNRSASGDTTPAAGLTPTSNVTPEAEATPTAGEKPAAEVSPGLEATPTPDATVPDTAKLKSMYGTAGREDVLEIPVEEASMGWTLITSCCAGDYALLWFTTPDDYDTDLRVLVLLKPCEGTTQYRLPVVGSIRNPIVLEDGTVIFEDLSEECYRVYDQTLTEQYTVPRDGGSDAPIIGVLPDGLIRDEYGSEPGLQYMVSEESQMLWCFHAKEDNWRGFVFPKYRTTETAAFRQDDVFCGDYLTALEDGSDVHEYRIYNVADRTVYGPLRATDISGFESLEALGNVGDCVLFNGGRDDGRHRILLWIGGTSGSPIAGFCDLFYDDTGDVMRSLMVSAEFSGVEIVPDREDFDETPESFRSFLAEMEMINTFLLAAETNPEVLKPKSGALVTAENYRNNSGGDHTFNRHVFSEFYLNTYGKERMETFFRFVDAVCAGEDSFECPDDAEEVWCCGRFADYFFPVAAPYVTAEYAGNGRAKITYKIPKQDFLKLEREFEEQVTAILNDVVEDDYSEIEKALALYEFMTEYVTYDVEMSEHLEDWSDRRSPYRILTERTGICWEIAAMYNYLLLQCGVNAETCDGDAFDPDEVAHSWSGIRLDGRYYWIDATWGLTDTRAPKLAYFLFTDEQREQRDGYDPKTYDIGSFDFFTDREKNGYIADDETFRELWSGTYVAMDEEENCIYYLDGSGELHRFAYGE